MGQSIKEEEFKHVSNRVHESRIRNPIQSTEIGIPMDH